MKIKLLPELMTKVREGNKTATTRLGIKQLNLGPAKLVNSEDSSDTIDILIRELRLVTKLHLACDQGICDKEGYAEPEDLVAKIESIYGPVEDSQEFTVIQFKVLKEVAQTQTSSQPVTPRNVEEFKKKSMPEGVIEAFNELITKNWSNGYATVMQNEVIDLIVDKVERATRRKVFDNHWLDVEDIFRKEGWKVEYDKPAYCETYEASFKFSK